MTPTAVLAETAEAENAAPKADTGGTEAAAAVLARELGMGLPWTLRFLARAAED